MLAVHTHTHVVADLQLIKLSWWIIVCVNSQLHWIMSADVTSTCPYVATYENVGVDVTDEEIKQGLRSMTSIRRITVRRHSNPTSKISSSYQTANKLVALCAGTETKFNATLKLDCKKNVDRELTTSRRRSEQINENILTMISEVNWYFLHFQRRSIALKGYTEKWAKGGQLLAHSNNQPELWTRYTFYDAILSSRESGSQ